MPTEPYRSPIPLQLWDAVRDEFGLPTLAQVREWLEAASPDPEQALRQLVRVFIDEDTYCPGFQFLPGVQLHPTVVELFQRAMEMEIPHNCFAVWMVTPSNSLGGSRPVDLLGSRPSLLFGALDAFGRRAE